MTGRRILAPALAVGLAATSMAAAGLPAAAQALPAPTPPCTDRATTVELERCLAGAAKAADGRLNATYQQVMGALGPADRSRLVQVERLWLQYRDAACGAERDLYEGGTASGPAYVGCLQAKTDAREQDLRAAYGERLQQSIK